MTNRKLYPQNAEPAEVAEAIVFNTQYEDDNKIKNLDEATLQAIKDKVNEIIKRINRED